jgi:hypothetical protein
VSNIPSNIRHRTDISARRTEICGNPWTTPHVESWDAAR